MEPTKHKNDQLKEIRVITINRKLARAYILKNHYMKTFPPATAICFGIVFRGRLCGVITFGYSSQTDKKVHKLLPVLDKNEYIEMQRMNILDILGHNAESYSLSKVMDYFKEKTNMKLIITHAGGCKNDCGIVYQASSWLYFGEEACSDFYLTKAGEYKNLIAEQRFGRAPKGIRDKQRLGEMLFGPGEVIYAHRHLYAYPLQKGVRARLEKGALPYPKNSAIFRRGQQWQQNEGGSQ